MEILRAEPSDTNEIHHIMSLASSLLDDKGWYCTDTEDYILEHIADRHKGIVFKAAHQGRIGAFFIIHYPGGGMRIWGIMYIWRRKSCKRWLIWIPWPCFLISAARVFNMS